MRSMFISEIIGLELLFLMCDKTYLTLDEAICVRDSILLGRKEDK